MATPMPFLRHTEYSLVVTLVMLLLNDLGSSRVIYDLPPTFREGNGNHVCIGIMVNDGLIVLRDFTETLIF